MIWKARNDEKDGLEVGGDQLRKTDCVKTDRDQYVILKGCDPYSFAEMVLMEPRGNLDDVWQENWLEMLNELADTTWLKFMCGAKDATNMDFWGCGQEN